MLSTHLVGLARRMQRVGEQQQTRDKFRLFGTEHAGLASAVGVSAEGNASGYYFLHRGDGVAQAGTITGRIARAGRSVSPQLAIREVAAQDCESGAGEGVGKCDQQWGCGI